MFATSATVAAVGVLLAAAVSAAPTAFSNKNHGKSNTNGNANVNSTLTVAKALGKSKFVVTEGTITAVDTTAKTVTAYVKNSNRKALRKTTVVLNLANNAHLRLGQTGFLRVEGLVINAGKRVTLDKLMAGDTLLFASGTSDGAGKLTANKVFVRRTAFQINGYLTAVDAVSSPMTLVQTVQSATKPTGLAAGASATSESTTGVKVKRDGVTATWSQLTIGDFGVVKGYITLTGTTKVFHATSVKALSPAFLVNQNANANSNSNTNS